MNFDKEPVDAKKKIADRMIKQYPDRRPVIVTPSSEKDPVIDKQKYLCPAEMSLGKFQFELRKHIKLSSDEAIFLFIVTPEKTHVLVQTTHNMLQIYEKYKHVDDFLYLVYSKESTFGN
jgi:GABA(A) receptor-associated protein